MLGSAMIIATPKHTIGTLIGLSSVVDYPNVLIDILG